MTPKLLTMPETADRLRVPVDTLKRWRKVRKGPRGERIGRSIMYLEEDVTAWIRAQFEGPGHPQDDTSVTQDRGPRPQPVPERP